VKATRNRVLPVPALGETRTLAPPAWAIGAIGAPDGPPAPGCVRPRAAVWELVCEPAAHAAPVPPATSAASKAISARLLGPLLIRTGV
jgi:hypothetical protein